MQRAWGVMALPSFQCLQAHSSPSQICHLELLSQQLQREPGPSGVRVWREYKTGRHSCPVRPCSIPSHPIPS
jgi:hypothetical protein